MLGTDLWMAPWPHGPVRGLPSAPRPAPSVADRKSRDWLWPCFAADDGAHHCAPRRLL